ncbi:MAG: sigma-70 family RNA polymerase sigma factor [Dehalococcoidia bacterium]|nr:sigma-70 family RNA polymerase sigma factor [Dehalococcoidia bacterium]MDW8120621.1 sigma-70 family RNA polymerase sigma factor [Chloroflexota bacterium]
MDEQEAIRLCQQGDREAFRTLVERYQDILLGTALLMTGDPALAEDLVQEAFLAAWQGMGGFDTRRPLKPWLVRILVNKALNTLRRRGQPAVPLDAATTHSALADPTEVALRRERHHALREALATLPSEHRQALLLRYYTDLTVPEIAHALGWREGTVKSRLHRALAHLREVLGPRLGEEGTKA